MLTYLKRFYTEQQNIRGMILGFHVVGDYSTSEIVNINWSLVVLNCLPKDVTLGRPLCVQSLELFVA